MYIACSVDVFIQITTHTDQDDGVVGYQKVKKLADDNSSSEEEVFVKEGGTKTIHHSIDQKDEHEHEPLNYARELVSYYLRSSQSELALLFLPHHHQSPFLTTINHHSSSLQTILVTFVFLSFSLSGLASGMVYYN